MTETADLSVGFIGLGRMGTPMARRVAEAGFSLTVWNRTDERCEPLSSIGAAVAETPKALAEQCDVVVTMVADADALRAILQGDEGLLAGLRPESIVVDTSTIGPTAAIDLAQAVSGAGLTGSTLRCPAARRSPRRASWHS